MRVIFFPIFIGLMICLLGAAAVVAEEAVTATLEELLNTKISTAAKYEQETAKAPASVTVITAEEIELFGYRTLAEILNRLRGFYTSYDRNYTYLGVRGFSRPSDYNNRILLQINGRTVNDRIFGMAYIGPELGIDLELVQRIEIVRGPGAALYGGNAMFAVINIITRPGNRVDGYRVSGEYGSDARRYGSVLMGGKFGVSYEWTVSAFAGHVDGDDLYYAEYDDPETHNGIASDLDWEKWHGAFAAFNTRHLQLQARYAWREKSVPTGAWDMLFGHEDARTLDSHGFVELKYDRDLTPNKHLMVRSSFNFYDYEADYPYPRSELEAGLAFLSPQEDSIEAVVFYDTSEGRWIESEVQFFWDTRANNRLIMGVESTNQYRATYRYGYEDERYFPLDGDDNFPYDIISTYVQDEYQVLSNLALTAGVRYDAYSTGEHSTNPRIAVVFHPARQSDLKLIYGKAFRAPNVYERNYEEPDYWALNPDLKPETIHTGELVWDHTWHPNFRSSLSLYHYEVNDLIDQTYTGADSLLQFANFTGVSSTGLEVGVQAQLSARVRAYLNYSYQDADDENDQELTNSPNHMLKGGAACRFLADRLTLATEARYESSRLTVYGTKTDDYVVANVHVSGSVGERLRLECRISNVFDTQFKTPGGFEHRQKAIEQDGRNVIIGLKVAF